MAKRIVSAQSIGKAFHERHAAGDGGPKLELRRSDREWREAAVEGAIGDAPARELGSQRECRQGPFPVVRQTRGAIKMRRYREHVTLPGSDVDALGDGSGHVGPVTETPCECTFPGSVEAEVVDGGDVAVLGDRNEAIGKTQLTRRDELVLLGDG